MHDAREQDGPAADELLRQVITTTLEQTGPLEVEVQVERPRPLTLRGLVDLRGGHLEVSSDGYAEHAVPDQPVPNTAPAGTVASQGPSLMPVVARMEAAATARFTFPPEQVILVDDLAYHASVLPGQPITYVAYQNVPVAEPGTPALPYALGRPDTTLRVVHRLSERARVAATPEGVVLTTTGRELPYLLTGHTGPPIPYDSTAANRDLLVTLTLAGSRVTGYAITVESSSPLADTPASTPLLQVRFGPSRPSHALRRPDDDQVQHAVPHDRTAARARVGMAHVEPPLPIVPGHRSRAGGGGKRWTGHVRRPAIGHDGQDAIRRVVSAQRALLPADWHLEEPEFLVRHATIVPVRGPGWAGGMHLRYDPEATSVILDWELHGEDSPPDTAVH